MQHVIYDIEIEIDKLVPMLRLLEDQIHFCIEKYEAEEKYEECSLLFRYDQNVKQLLSVFRQLNHF